MIVEQLTILEAVWRGRADKGEQPVLTFIDALPDGQLVEEQRSYADLWRNGSAVSAALKAEGMSPGDSFGLIMHNHPEFVDAMVGAALAGTVYVPVDPRTAANKVKFMLNFADCRGVVIADYALETLASTLSELPKLEWVWVLGYPGAAASVSKSLRINIVAEILDRPTTEEPLKAIDPTLVEVEGQWKP